MIASFGRTTRFITSREHCSLLVILGRRMCLSRNGGNPEHLRQLCEELGYSGTCPLANMRLPQLVVCMLGLGERQRPGRKADREVLALEELKIHTHERPTKISRCSVLTSSQHSKRWSSSCMSN
eukprot:6197281-Amphidinium_carterae.1